MFSIVIEFRANDGASDIEERINDRIKRLPDKTEIKHSVAVNNQDAVGPDIYASFMVFICK